jgi:hypothetical protein
MLRVCECIQNLDGEQSLSQKLVKTREIIGSGFCADRRDDRLTMFDADVPVLWKTIIRCTGYLLKFGAEVLHELFPVDWNAGLFSVAANLPVIIRPRDQPLAVIPNLFPTATQRSLA